MNANRVIISPTISSANVYTSSLQFTYLMEGDDEGAYTCNVTILEISESHVQSVILSLLNSKLYSGINFIHYCLFIVPTPTVNAIVPGPQRVGQSLTLRCSGTTVRGIISKVYIVWRRDNTTVNTTHITAKGQFTSVQRCLHYHTIEHF